jgi:hypothetical protein
MSNVSRLLAVFPSMQTTPMRGLFYAAAILSTLAACGDETWLRDASQPGDPIFDPRRATEIRSLWYVSAPKIGDAAHLLESNGIVAISQDDAVQLIGHVSRMSLGEALYLVRGIDVSDPIPLRVYQAENRLQVSAGTRST